MPKGTTMVRPLKRKESGSQLNLLLPINGRISLRVRSIAAADKSKIEESRKRLLKDLEGTGLRTPK
jgi:hypothetical protein